MATMSGATLTKILAPQFVTGGTTSDVPDPGKKPGVMTYSSAFAKADQRELDSVGKVTRKLSIGIVPFMTEDKANAGKMERYARRCAVDALNRGEACMMTNLAFYDSGWQATPVERDVQLHGVMAWMPKAQVVAVYVDFGITPAMQICINVAEVKNRKIEYRSIGATA